MSEILGHDVNGRPLRAGDRVVYVGDIKHVIGEQAKRHIRDVFIVKESAPEYGLGVLGSPFLRFCGGFYGECASVRRLDDRTDHQPSEYTFDSLMDHLKSGVPA